MDTVMDTPDNIGIKLCVMAALRNISCEYLSLFCLFTICSDSVSALQILFSNSSYERRKIINICVKELVDLLLYSKFTPTCFG
jgi:hypothetical protein